MSRFSPEDYKAEGGFTLLGVPVLLAALCAAAVGLGWLASFIGQWFYLIAVFPIGIGVGLAGVGLLVGQLVKMRNPLIAGLFGMIGSAVALVAMHYFDYQRVIAEGPVPGVDSLLNYLHASATVGVTINGGHGGKGGINLGYIGSWIYWGAELVLVALMATFGMVAAAAEPFCSACNSWKKERKLGQLNPREGDVAALLREGEIERLKNHDPSPIQGELFLHVNVLSQLQHRGTHHGQTGTRDQEREKRGTEERTRSPHLPRRGAARFRGGVCCTLVGSRPGKNHAACSDRRIPKEGRVSRMTRGRRGGSNSERRITMD